MAQTLAWPITAQVTNAGVRAEGRCAHSHHRGLYDELPATMSLTVLPSLCSCIASASMPSPTDSPPSISHALMYVLHWSVVTILTDSLPTPYAATATGVCCPWGGLGLTLPGPTLRRSPLQGDVYEGSCSTCGMCTSVCMRKLASLPHAYRALDMPQPHTCANSASLTNIAAGSRGHHHEDHPAVSCGNKGGSEVCYGAR